ncbi:leukocyte receptor cluster member 9 [Pygocentrus nattereri]|uniref:C3H1-type domain-containing protein n=1 Tax=Pygocentrus nattereri TaxID=42514 RepID=A0AAR2K6J9_PYGNA|nr:leukocyte receptor cluster member 9 [Pygocentrus nattereri]
MASAEEGGCGKLLTGQPEAQAESDVTRLDSEGLEVCKFFLWGRCRFGERCRLSHSASVLAGCKLLQAEEGGSKNGKSRRSSGRGDKGKNGESEKKPRMRTADDVISRILWDSSVDPADFVVGHLDRFQGVLERPFSDFSWDTQVCDCDYSDELAIPQHRIQYFSYKGQRMWDKDSRTDRVFGSTGQTVLPPFEQEDEGQEHGAQDTPQEGDESQTEKKERISDRRDPEDAADCGANGPKDEGFGDARLAREAKALSVSPRVEQIAPEEEWKDWGEEEEEEEEKETQPIPQEPQPGRPSRKPTHFICFRVDSPAALMAFQRVQRKILTHLPQSEEFWVKPATLHITLSLLVLPGPAEVQAAAKILQSIVSDFYKPPISVFFPLKLKHFNGKVLFLPPRPVQDVQSINTPLQEAFREKGWLHRHSKCPIYHLTLAKVEGEETKKMFEDVGAIKLAKDINFGKLEVDKLYLCVNGMPKTNSGFYQVVCAVKFPTV